MARSLKLLCACLTLVLIPQVLSIPRGTNILGFDAGSSGSKLFLQKHSQLNNPKGFFQLAQGEKAVIPKGAKETSTAPLTLTTTCGSNKVQRFAFEDVPIYTTKNGATFAELSKAVFESNMKKKPPIAQSYEPKSERIWHHVSQGMFRDNDISSMWLSMGGLLTGNDYFPIVGHHKRGGPSDESHSLTEWDHCNEVKFTFESNGKTFLMTLDTKLILKQCGTHSLGWEGWWKKTYAQIEGDMAVAIVVECVNLDLSGGGKISTFSLRNVILRLSNGSDDSSPANGGKATPPSGDKGDDSVGE